MYDKKLNKLTCLTQNYCQFDIVILFNTIKIGKSFKELECLCKQACNTCSIQVLWSTYLKEWVKKISHLWVYDTPRLLLFMTVRHNMAITGTTLCKTVHINLFVYLCFWYSFRQLTRRSSVCKQQGLLF